MSSVPIESAAPAHPDPSILPMTMPNAAEAMPAAITTFLDRFTQAIKFKEIAAFAALVPFVLGYASVAYNAYHNNLGFIPPLQFQCLLAGIVPTVIFAISSLALWFSFKLESKLTGFDHSRIEKLENLLLWMTLPVVFLCGALSVVAVVMENLIVSFFIAELLALVFFFGFSLHQYCRVRLKEGAFFIRYKFAQIGGFFGMLFICLSFWLRSIYPHLPQEVGGMQPRIAYLAVTRTQLSPEMRQAIMPSVAQKLPADPAKDPLAVAQTILLDVVYENSDALFVRAHTDEFALPDQPPTVYQIKKSSIQGVTWKGFDRTVAEPKQVDHRLPVATKITKVDAG